MECVEFLSVCPQTMYVPGTLRGQKRVLDFLELELQMAVSQLLTDEPSVQLL